jgi:hypothetical protein
MSEKDDIPMMALYRRAYAEGLRDGRDMRLGHRDSDFTAGMVIGVLVGCLLSLAFWWFNK